jgi:sec-independent protein translocase protein TatB
MFDIAWTEYLLIAVVALVLLGPKELPVVLKTLGRWVAKARQLTTNFERQLYALDEPPLEKYLPTEDLVKDESVSHSLMNYQRVFYNQHLNEKTGKDVVKSKAPYPKPWL